MKKLVLANPRGFCAGADRAVHIVERALEKYGTPIYVRHEIVHNQFVVDGLKKRGVIFVEELSEVPEGSIVIFSAHGVAASVYEEAERRNLKTLDAKVIDFNNYEATFSMEKEEVDKVFSMGSFYKA